MKCPRCGANNADDARVCGSCGAELVASVTEDDVDELMGQLPTVAAQRREEEERTRLLQKFAEQTRVLDDETQLVDGETQLLDGERDEETRLLQDETRLLDDRDADGEPAGEDDNVTVPGVIPVDATQLRPVARQHDEEHFVVRNTRDYDHDAQSINLAAGADNFDTITEKRPSRRDSRRDPYARSARKGQELGEGKSRSKLRPFLALLLVALVLGGGGAVLTYGMELWGGKTVPSLVGESQANAEARLAEKGLVARIEAQPADDAIGKVLSQDPDVGTRVPEGGEVTLVIATNRMIPEVIGMPEGDARAVLQSVGAEQIETVTRPSGEPEGTVIDVSPGQGQPFVSRSVVTLTVAAPFTVPDVLGKKESDALGELQGAGFATEVEYITSDATVRTVVETLPGPGEVIEQGGMVHVRISSPYPSSPLHLAEFLGHSSQDIDAFLESQGYWFVQGMLDSYGNAMQVYSSEGNGTYTFSSQPYSRPRSLPEDSSSNVMATGVPFAGVRFDFPAHMMPIAADQPAAEWLAGECGYGQIEDICTNGSFALPAGTRQVSVPFVCASGKSGDSVWTILIVNTSSGMRASTICAKQSVYSAGDLAPFNGSISQFVAYQEIYQSGEYVSVPRTNTTANNQGAGQGNNQGQEAQNNGKQQGQ